MGKKGGEAEDQTEQYLQKHLVQFRELMARPFVQGRDLIEAGFRPGPEFGEALRYAHKMRLSGVPKEEALRQTVAFLNKGSQRGEKTDQTEV